MIAWFQVDGYDAAGKRLFSREVFAINEVDADLVASAELRRTPNGADLMTRAERLEAKKVARRSRTKSHGSRRVHGRDRRDR